MSEVEFKPWPKIQRGGGTEQVTITEKLDGTNSCIIIQDGEIVGVQSRKRMITPGKNTDNYGFAQWVEDNSAELLGLGDGYHYGEWAGVGIQKNPLGLESKRFYLFNVARWNLEHQPPTCCYVVPVLYSGEYRPDIIEEIMDSLKANAPHDPEGVVVWYHKARRYEKYTYNFVHGKWGEK
jgi:hypothetical protein